MRFLAYLNERFPPLAYTLLVALFHGAASLAAVALGGGRVQWASAGILLLTFFHLRVFDEHKDYAGDLEAHPERLLSRGVVTLPFLSWAGAVAIVGESALALWSGWPTAIAWAATLFFTVAMRYEFGIGEWLRPRLILYAVTHNPVVAGLAMVSWASTGARWDARYLWVVAAVSLGSFALEVGRKVRLPSEEIPSVPSYSSILGRDSAARLVSGIGAAATLCAVMLTSALSPEIVCIAPAALGLAVLQAMARRAVPAKKVELGASLALIGLFLSIGWAAWR